MALNLESLQKPIRKLRKDLKGFSKTPSPDEVHRLRTQTRRTEALVHALAFDQKQEGTRLLKTLKPVRRAAGEVRDMDVLVESVSSLEKDSEGECIVQLIEHLAGRRIDGAGKLHKVIFREQKEARRYLKQCSRNIEDAHSTSPADLVQMSVHSMAVSLQLETELREWPNLSEANLHPYRLKVKELRYILQMTEGSPPEFVDALGEVKDRIGNWHDWSELVSIAEQALDHGSSCNVITQIQRRTNEEFERALSITNAMRGRYLSDGEGQAVMRKRSAVGVKSSVVNTTSRLAG